MGRYLGNKTYLKLYYSVPLSKAEKRNAKRKILLTIPRTLEALKLFSGMCSFFNATIRPTPQQAYAIENIFIKGSYYEEAGLVNRNKDVAAAVFCRGLKATQKYLRNIPF